MNLADIADALDNDGLDSVDSDRRQAEIELPELLEVCLEACLSSAAGWTVCGWFGIADWKRYLVSSLK